MALDPPAAGSAAVRRPVPPAVLALVLAFGVVLLAGAVVSYSRAAEPPPATRAAVADSLLGPVEGVPAVTAHAAALYPPHDRWASYLAGEDTCPGGERADLPLTEQVAVMVCLIDFARERRGLGRLVPTALLDDSSLAKATRIVGCRQFTHAACGIAPASEARGGGYRGAFGENLYIASGPAGAPRVALDGWLNSAGHRANLFRPEWRIEGIAVETLPQFGPYENAVLWVHQLGTG